MDAKDIPMPTPEQVTPPIKDAERASLTSENEVLERENDSLRSQIIISFKITKS